VEIESPRRELLLTSAAEVFARQGYRATSLDDIAGMLGVRKASLYHYINGKQDLLLEIYDRLMDRIERDVGPIAEDQSLPADERLRRMVLAHISVVAEERDMMTVVVREEFELEEPRQSAIIKRKHDYEALFERVVSEGQEDGVFRNLTPRLVVLGLLGMANWMYQWFRADRYSADEVAGEFLLLLERGWLSDGDDRRRVLPRADSVDGALRGVDEQVAALRGTIEHLSDELAAAREQLSEGLANRSGGR
jgi:AcrR family transcriptional regulator